jgi:hypothetical protein
MSSDSFLSLYRFMGINVQTAQECFISDFYCTGYKDIWQGKIFITPKPYSGARNDSLERGSDRRKQKIQPKPEARQ